MLAAVEQHHRQPVAELGAQAGVTGGSGGVDVGGRQVEIKFGGQFLQLRVHPIADRAAGAGQQLDLWAAHSPSVAVNLAAPKPWRPRGIRSSPGELCGVRTVISFTAMAERELLRVNPEVMHGASQALSGAAKDLHTRLIELDGQVREMLAGWRGGAGGAYGQAWDLWHRGAGEVELGLSILAKAVGIAGVDFQAQDSVSAQALRGV